jgi:hypothetical protein
MLVSRSWPDRYGLPGGGLGEPGDQPLGAHRVALRFRLQAENRRLEPHRDRNARVTMGGGGQSFTPRPLNDGMSECLATPNRTNR